MQENDVTPSRVVKMKTDVSKQNDVTLVRAVICCRKIAAVFHCLYRRAVLELEGPSMLPDKAKFVMCSIISLILSFWIKHLVIGQLQKPAKFSAFHWSTSRSSAFIGQLLGTSRVVHLPKRIVMV